MPKFAGKGLGKGHGGNSSLPDIKPVDLPLPIINMILLGNLPINTKAYTLGECFVLMSMDSGGLWTLSISHTQRYPTWDEVAKARYELLPEEKTYVMYLPPKREYINVHNFCFILNELLEGQVSA